VIRGQHETLRGTTQRSTALEARCRRMTELSKLEIPQHRSVVRRSPAVFLWALLLCIGLAPAQAGDAEPGDPRPIPPAPIPSPPGKPIPPSPVPPPQPEPIPPALIRWLP